MKELTSRNEAPANIMEYTKAINYFKYGKASNYQEVIGNVQLNKPMPFSALKTNLRKCLKSSLRLLWNKNTKLQDYKHSQGRIQ